MIFFLNIYLICDVVCLCVICMLLLFFCIAVRGLLHVETSVALTLITACPLPSQPSETTHIYCTHTARADLPVCSLSSPLFLDFPCFSSIHSLLFIIYIIYKTTFSLSLPLRLSFSPLSKSSSLLDCLLINTGFCGFVVATDFTILLP